MAETGLNLITANPLRKGFRTAIQDAQSDRRFEEESQQRQDALLANERSRNLDEALAGLLSGPAANQEPAAPVPGAVGTPAAPADSRMSVGRGLANQGFGGEALSMITAGEQAQRAQAETLRLENRADTETRRLEGREDARLAQTRQDEAERRAFVALANYGKTGNQAYLAEFRQFSAQANISIPEEALVDIRAAGLFAEGSLIAERIYSGNPAQAQKFLQAYIQFNGNLEQAAGVAGPPTDKPNWDVLTVVQNGKHVLALLDKTSGRISIPTQEAPVQPDPNDRFAAAPRTEPQPFEVPSTSTADKSPAKLKIVQWLLDNGVATGPDHAWQLVNLGVESPNKIRAQIFNGTFKALTGNPLKPMSTERATEEANKIADQFVERMFELGQIGGAPGSVQQGGAVQEMPITADGRVDESKAQPGQTYTIGGQRYRYDGPNAWTEIK